jgi:ubiquinone/menaquinone biosynthesis C-methylase UbiE
MTKDKFYNTIAKDFDSIMNMYDLNRRIEVIFDDFLSKDDLKGKTMLDGGCGTGFFSKHAVKRGADVTAVDIAESLVEITKRKVPGMNGITASILELPFLNNQFDYVFSSDVIEHTPNPYIATLELIRVLKPGGKLCITVPNRSFWYFSVLIANALKLRNYHGYENWVPYRKYKKFLEKNGIKIHMYKGVHLFPFVFNPLNTILYSLDKIFERTLGVFMVNIAVYGEKRSSTNLGSI